ncbi:MAG: B12-binding domain-containing radical SAM protein, partial [Anaerolineae bacterium]|nr:B12-binding domain-containing radical SAM protein [Anaerolineae bacterium]
TEEDVRAIAHLAHAVLDLGRRYHHHKAQVRVSVSTFVPQPHTPFQWAALDPPELIRHKQQLLRHAFGHRHGIIYNWNDPHESLLEAALTRGDRRVGQAILTAWQNGCRFDAWHEHFKPASWEAAFRMHNLDMHWYATRPRDADEVFPWDHIETGVSRAWLWADWQAALRGEVKVDCRHICHGCGILHTFAELRRAGLTTTWQCPSVASATSSDE